MSEPSPADKVLAPSAPALSTEEIKYRENDVIINILRLALGRAPQQRKGPLFAAEVGVYRGRTLALIAAEIESAGVEAVIAGFDSFAGLPKFSETDSRLANALMIQRRNLMYADVSRREVEAFLAPFNGAKNIELHEGYFEQTFPAAPDRQYFFVNISCKLHSSHMLALNYFYPRLQKGGVILFDDYLDRSSTLAKVAIEEFLSDKPEPLYQLQCGDGMSTFRRAFLVKR
jgi:hypothetical protein